MVITASTETSKTLLVPTLGEYLRTIKSKAEDLRLILI